ncbi:DNA sulfur modification protein DndD [Nakamurella panacisegetis]|uniref:DNA sulfur modification protein DndD n=1 Tax=Nakamurella panacisegetis TaxID=1090615 RepID=A0A1H0IUU1_9ACTN|nr:DNA sulfur modification protein DndD [Nakamurella panacisegetis]
MTVDGRHDEALTSTWNEHVETFLPRGIAGLFFFDGEQIEALAGLERSRQVLAAALAALLGLDLVERLTHDLAVLRRRHRNSQVPDELRQSIDERRDAATAVRKAEEAAADVVAVARVESERADKRLHEVTERYRAAGGDLLDQRDAAETRLAMLRDQLNETDDHLRSELVDVAPLLLVKDLIAQLADQAGIEATATRERLLVDVIASRDAALLGELKKARVSAAAMERVERYLLADRTQRADSAEVAVVTGLPDATPIDSVASIAMPACERRLGGLIRRRHELAAELEQAERVLVAIPDPEALAPLRAELDDASHLAVRAHASLVDAEEQLNVLRHERSRADDAYEAALDRAAHATLAADDDRRVVEHADRVRTTLDSLSRAATERHLSRISALVLEALGRLLRKSRLISDVRIDVETKTVELTGADGRPLAAQELSAGERQLLAVALLWGLARAAGQPLPMIIDTPLGRLDGSHREHLLERYFPHASHQVILLSTDTEIDADAYASIRSRVGRAYRLEFDQTANATSVHAGYFWE